MSKSNTVRPGKANQPSALPRAALSAFDREFRWTKAQREANDASILRHYSGGIHSLGYAVTMLAQAHRKREAWLPHPDGFNKKQIHLAPSGVYFKMQGNSGAFARAGVALYPDGSVEKFKGSEYRPLHCLYCGRVDLRGSEDYDRTPLDCVRETRIPPHLLRLLPSDPHSVARRRKELAARRKRLKAEERRKAEVAAASKAVRAAEVAAREAASQARYEAQEAQRAREAAQGPFERAARSVISYAKELALWLLFFMLLGIASRGF
jgi:hypothetical protein